MEKRALSSLAGIPAVHISATPRHRNILAVVGDPIDRHCLSEALSSDPNYTLRFAETGAEAHSLLAEQEGVDLFFCDLSGPDSSGAELIASLRMQGERAPIMALLSDRSFESLARALNAGADDWLVLPVNPHDLCSAASQLIARFSERERRSEKRAALSGAAVALIDRDGPALQMTAHTDSAQIESFLRFGERLATGELPPVEQMYLRQALEELVQNAKEWGNRFDAAKKVRLECSLKPDRIVFGIEDEGEGFDPTVVPDPSIDPRAHIRHRIASGKRMGGWGLFIARKRMDELEFNARGNRVRIAKFFRRA